MSSNHFGDSIENPSLQSIQVGEPFNYMQWTSEKKVYPRKVNSVQESLFDRLDSFGIEYKSEKKLFENLAVMDFESVWV